MDHLYQLEEQNATMFPLTLLGGDSLHEGVNPTQDTDSTPHFRKELIRGIVISVPIVAALILAPLLLSYKKRLARRKKKRNENAAHSSQTDNNVAEEIPLKTQDSEEKGAETPQMKSNLKRCKIYFPPKPNPEPDIIRSSIRNDVRPVSVDMGEGWSFLCNPVARLGGRNLRSGSQQGGDACDSTSHSRLTVYENNAYEDTIPSNIGSRADITGVVEPYANSPYLAFVQPSNFTPSKQECTQVKADIHKEHGNNLKVTTRFGTQLFPSENPKIAQEQFSSPNQPSEIATGQNLNSLQRKLQNDKEAWVPLYNREKIDTVIQKKAENTASSTIQYQTDCVEKSLENNRNGSSAKSSNGSSNSPQKVKEIHLRKAGDFLPFPAKNYASERVLPLEICKPLYCPTPYSFANEVKPIFSSRKSRSKRRVRKTRRERDKIRLRWQHRLYGVHPDRKTGSNQSYASANNDQISGYVGIRLHPDLSKHQSDSDCREVRCKPRKDESSLLEEIWKYLSILVEKSTRDLNNSPTSASSRTTSSEKDSVSSADTLKPSSSSSTSFNFVLTEIGKPETTKNNKLKNTKSASL